MCHCSSVLHTSEPSGQQWAQGPSAVGTLHPFLSPHTSGHSSLLTPSHPVSSFLHPVSYTVLECFFFFFFPTSRSKSFHRLEREAKKGYTCSGRKPGSNLSPYVSPYQVLPFSDKATIDGARPSSSLTESLPCCPRQKMCPKPRANKSC